MLKANFHYAIHVAHLVADLVSDLSQTGSSYRHVEIARTCGRRPVQAIFHYAILLASKSATSWRAGRKLDSVTEFGRELVCDLLASWTA